jgi:hypothetical protein
MIHRSSFAVQWGRNNGRAKVGVRRSWLSLWLFGAIVLLLLLNLSCGESAKDAAEEVKDAAAEAAETVGETVEEGAEAIGEAAEAVGEAVEEGSEAVGEAIEDAKETAEEIVEDAQEAVEEAGKKPEKE